MKLILNLLYTISLVNTFEVQDALEKMRTIATYPLFRSHS